MKPSGRTRPLLAVAGLLLGLAGSEALVRWRASGNDLLGQKLREWDPRASQIEPLGPHCFRLRPGAIVHFPNGTVAHVNAMGFRGPEVALPKPAGTFRVVILGGSTTHGWGVADDDAIDAHLRRALSAAHPGARIEVVNLGADGLDALCDLERLRREGLPLDPDAVIVHDGVNDAFGARFAGLPPDSPERGFRAIRVAEEAARRSTTGLWADVKHYVYLARLPGVVKHLRGAASLGPVPGPGEPAAGGLDGFEATLRAMADATPEGAILLFSSPPSALRAGAEVQAPSSVLVVDRETTQRYRDRLDERMRGVAADLAARGRRAAYVPHDLPPQGFLDECHLTSDGNRQVADDFARALAALGAP